MRAHFTRHVFAPHSHDAYSFAVTETGAQQFTCRGAAHTSGAGMVMAFNPDDPHDGCSAAAHGFRYRIVHLGPAVVREALADAAGAPGSAAPLPLFDVPVRTDPVLREAVLRLHHALANGAGPLVRDERLSAAVTALVRRGATGAPPRTGPGAGRAAARRARDLLADAGGGEVSAAALAAAAGCSRFALYRAFRATYGMAPSDYQRLLRLRTARRLLARGLPPSEAAATAGFADQSHLHRWFVRCYGITPAAYRRSAAAL
ncbi:AraC family transcriptional regulator [Streptomyces sp. DSM 44917]|uniref:AraC family transcriptional regulator n=1 Tax=Streptomyces boetiae TaxID=3075541 RepID=A0ABU2L9Q4_9ACTN|nr:AraC family transcriptional regulator [Streptomyces sp. DSM 44917]MDT0308298.1 AraC family transcriptional regulator [Streptomyces sp. DSM 44917]